MTKKEFFISNKKKIIFLLFIILICAMHFIITFEKMPKDPSLINEIKEKFNYVYKKEYKHSLITNELIKKYIYPGMDEQEALDKLKLFFNEKIELEKKDSYHIYYIDHIYDEYTILRTTKIYIYVKCSDGKVKDVSGGVKLSLE